MTRVRLGAPEGETFEGAVTRGGISISRVLRGFKLIQSEAVTAQGAEGGRTLFAPIKDAIDLLALDLR